MIDLGEILEEINVPDLSCPLALQSNTDNPKEKDLFAEQKRHAWDKSSKRVATSPVKSASHEGQMCSLSRFGRSRSMGAH